MALRIGDEIPNVRLGVMIDGAPAVINSDALFVGKTIALFGVPGAFTKTCSERHLPGFIANASNFADKGVDEIACLSVNDPWVMRAWAQSLGALGVVTMLADGALNFTKATGLEVDLTEKCYGIRCQRFSMIVRDKRVEVFHRETSGRFGETSAENLLNHL